MQKIENINKSNLKKIGNYLLIKLLDDVPQEIFAQFLVNGFNRERLSYQSLERFGYASFCIIIKLLEYYNIDIKSKKIQSSLFYFGIENNVKYYKGKIREERLLLMICRATPIFFYNSVKAYFEKNNDIKSKNLIRKLSVQLANNLNLDNKKHSAFYALGKHNYYDVAFVNSKRFIMEFINNNFASSEEQLQWYTKLHRKYWNNNNENE